MTKRNALIRAERVGDDLQLEFRGKHSDVFTMYRAITSQIFGGFVHAAKGEDKKEIASNSVNALIHVVIDGVGEAFEECDELDKELKPFVKDAVKEVIKDFEVDIDEYFADEDNASNEHEAKTLLDVLNALAALMESTDGLKKENTK